MSFSWKLDFISMFVKLNLCHAEKDQVKRSQLQQQLRVEDLFQSQPGLHSGGNIRGEQAERIFDGFLNSKQSTPPQQLPSLPQQMQLLFHNSD